MDGFKTFYNKLTMVTESEHGGHFFVSAIVPVGEERKVTRVDGTVYNMPENSNRDRVLGAFISRYYQNVNGWIAEAKKRSPVVRWIPDPKSMKQQEFNF